MQEELLKIQLHCVGRGQNYSQNWFGLLLLLALCVKEKGMILLQVF